MSGVIGHLVIVPIILPLLVGAALIVIDDRRKRLKFVISEMSAVTLLATATFLLVLIDSEAVPDALSYRLGGWSASIGIVLVVDRLSAMMLVLTALLAIPCMAFATVRWQRAGPRVHTLFQLLLMGLNGAFLTGDLFNLFVFFEVLLAASYGLVLHGSGAGRVRAGLHYVAVNLVGSALLLVGISLIYGVLGTLNMAELAVRMAELGGDDRALAESGATILAVAFLIKAGAWPLCFWLPSTYAAASAPVAAVFAIMTKVGVYAVLRIGLLLFPYGPSPELRLGEPWLLIVGLLTIFYGMTGALASRRMARLAGYCAIVSSGTLLAVFGTGNEAAIGGALFYLVSSTLGVAALFLMDELDERESTPDEVYLPTIETFGEEIDMESGEDEIGIALTGMLATLGIALVACALVLAGMPPFPGFIGKFAIVHALLEPGGAAAGALPMATWIVIALLIISGLALLMALMRAGINAIWARDEEVEPIQALDFGAVAFLLLLCLALTVQGGAVMRYMDDTAHTLRNPEIYIRNVLAPEPLTDGPGEVR